MKKIFLLSLVISTIWVACTSSKQVLQPKSTSISSLKFLDEYVIPNDFKFKNTLVGGLSGIDYDEKNRLFYLVSDDRSAINPSRFYVAAIDVNKYKIDTIHFLAVHDLLQPDGSVYPSTKTSLGKAADPESIRYNPITKTLVWTSEGEKAKLKNGQIIAQNPWIFEMNLNGKYKDSFHLPHNLHMQERPYGPRTNGVFEGSTFADNYRFVYVNMEEPLEQDGPRADVKLSNVPIRITKFDMKTKQPVAQYAYLLDAVAKEPIPADAFRINGVPEILYIGDNKMLIMERSFSTGTQCVIKVYLANLSGATNVISMEDLKHDHFTAASKKLLLNMDDLGIYIDNVEGIAFGTILPNGHRSLILISDNNFESFEKTQVFLFEIIP